MLYFLCAGNFEPCFNWLMKLTPAFCTFFGKKVEPKMMVKLTTGFYLCETNDPIYGQLLISHQPVETYFFEYISLSGLWNIYSGTYHAIFTTLTSHFPCYLYEMVCFENDMDVP